MNIYKKTTVSPIQNYQLKDISPTMPFKFNLRYSLLKSPLRYPGGKSRAVPTILKFIPQETETVVSPFFGGGSLELTLANSGIKVYGYDAFKPLTIFWQELLKDAPKIANLVKEYHPLKSEKFYELQKNYFNFKNKKQRAAVFYVLNRASFSGTTLSGGMSLGHARFNLAAIERLKNFKVTNLSVEFADFQDSIVRHKDDLLYLDPPYLNKSNLYGKKGDMHSDFNHQKLAEILKSRNKWILSYNDCPIIRDYYKKFKILTPSWSYGMNSDKKSSEILILSQDIYEANQVR